MNLSLYLSSRAHARLVLVGSTSSPTLIFSARGEKPEEHVPLSKALGTGLELVVVASRCGWGAQLGKGENAETFWPGTPKSEIPSRARALLLSQARFVGVLHVPGGVRAVEGVIAQKGMEVERSARKLLAGASGWVGVEKHETGDERWPTKSIFVLNNPDKLRDIPQELRKGGVVYDALAADPGIIAWAQEWGPPPWERRPDPLTAALSAIAERERGNNSADPNDLPF